MDPSDWKDLDVAKRAIHRFNSGIRKPFWIRGVECHFLPDWDGKPVLVVDGSYFIILIRLDSESIIQTVCEAIAKRVMER